MDERLESKLDEALAAIEKMDTLTQELKGVAKRAVDIAEQELLAHTTTKLKLANAIGLLQQAQYQMEKYIPDGIEDSDYQGVYDQIGTFLTEIEKSKKQNG